MTRPGSKLRQVRLSFGLTYRDVESASAQIAAAKRRSDFFIPISRLSEIENHGAQPTIFRIYSLCSIYQLSFGEVLGWCGVDLRRLPADAKKFQPKRGLSVTHLLAEDAASLPRLPSGVASSCLTPPANNTNASASASETRFLEQDQGDTLPAPLTAQSSSPTLRYGRVGMLDCTMDPLIPPGSWLQIDMTRRRVEEGTWRNEFERPVYFVAHREGYTCSWCSMHHRTLILHPHPLSPCSPRNFESPREAEVLGQVVGLFKSLAPFRRGVNSAAAGRRESASR